MFLRFEDRLININTVDVIMVTEANDLDVEMFTVRLLCNDGGFVDLIEPNDKSIALRVFKRISKKIERGGNVIDLGWAVDVSDIQRVGGLV